MRKELDNELLALMRQAHEGKSLSGTLISVDDSDADSLCCPLTLQQLRDIRACTAVKKHRLAFAIGSSKGFRARHIVVLVTVDFEGVTGSGSRISIRFDRVPVHVTISGKHPRRIDEIIAHPMM